MKSSKVIMIFIAQVLLFISCNKKSDIVISSFPDTIYLQGSALEVSPYFPKKIIVSDSLLIIQNEKGPFVFQIFNTNTLKKLAEVGSFGRGPEEFINPKCTGQVSESNGQKYHHFYDASTRRYSEINFLKSMEHNKLNSINRRVDKKIEDINRVIFNSEELIFAIPENSQDSRFTIYSHLGQKVKKIPFLPKMPFYILDRNKAKIYFPSGYCVNKFEKKVVLSPSYLGQLDFFNFSGDYLHSTFLDAPDQEVKKAASEPNFYRNNMIFYHTEMQNYDSLFYSLYLPVNISVMNAREEPCTESKIMVLDWEGNPKREYILDRPISAFAFDLNNNCFYGYSVFEELYPITRYNLK